MADYHFVGEEVVKNSILQMLSFSQEKFQGEGAYVTVFVVFSRSLMSDPLQPHGQQHNRLP